MNNDLEQFSEERLMELANEKSDCLPTWEESYSLARIALAAKQAKPVGYATRDENYDWHIDFCGEAHCLSQGDSLYTTPQPAHTDQGEMPDKALSLSESIEELRKYIDSSGGYNFEALRSEQVNSPVIPDGCKLVPEEATIAMLTLLGMTGSFEFMQQKYKNMLPAAPKPESE